MIVKAHRTVTTRGPLGESGTGYNWGELARYGDFSAATQGHIQGYDEPVEIEILALGAALAESNSGMPALYLPDSNRGYDAGEALALGYARIVPEES